MKRAYDLYDPLGKGHGTKSFYTTAKLRWMGLTAPDKGARVYSASILC